MPLCQDLSTEDNFTCCLMDKYINCDQSCSYDIMYLPTSILKCSGNGVTQDDTNIETSPVYNSTCPRGFKEISVKASFPVCLQCNDTSTANNTGTTSYSTTAVTMVAVILSVISVIGVIIIIIIFLVRRKRTRSTPVSTLEYKSQERFS